MQPESNQQSITSGTRCMVPPQPGCLQANVTSSIHGLWTTRCSLSDGSAFLAASNLANADGLRVLISSTDDGASRWPFASQIQMLSGVPQWRSRDSAQPTC